MLLLLAAALPGEVRDSAHDHTEGGRYPAHWWKSAPEWEREWWEILPEEARVGEVILSKRHELGLLSNFAPTPFVFRGVRYASLEGLWQMMKYPDGDDDPRRAGGRLAWPHTREEVMAMVAFEAKAAGDEADAILRRLGIDWVTFEVERIRPRGDGQLRHYEIIEAATRAKVAQNPEVEAALLATGDLVLMPDHHTDPQAPAAWRYQEILMKIRAELQAAQPRGE